jgi:cobalt-zinc-cadmium efflux system protein
VSTENVDPRHAHGHAHGHGYGHGHGSVRAPRRTLTYALVLTASFMIVEAVAGTLSGSLALLADAGHMLADAGALALALLAQIVADRPRTEQSTYGFRRAEVLAAFVNGIALAVVSVLVFREALERWLEPSEIRGSLMLATAVAGLVVNGLVATILMGGRRDNVNVRAAFAHVVADALGSVGAIVAGVLVFFFGWLRADAALSVGISLLVAISGYRILRETTNVLLESAPGDLPVDAIERTIAECPGVLQVHDLHVWRISQGFDTLTAHVVLEAGHHGVEVCRKVAERLRAKHGLSHVTIQPEAAAPRDTVPVRRGPDGEPLSAGAGPKPVSNT